MKKKRLLISLLGGACWLSTVVGSRSPTSSGPTHSPLSYSDVCYRPPDTVMRRAAPATAAAAQLIQPERKYVVVYLSVYVIWQSWLAGLEIQWHILRLEHYECGLVSCALIHWPLGRAAIHGLAIFFSWKNGWYGGINGSTFTLKFLSSLTFVLCLTIYFIKIL
jgi:hypothetical protein